MIWNRQDQKLSKKFVKGQADFKVPTKHQNESESPNNNTLTAEEDESFEGTEMMLSKKKQQYLDQEI